MGKKARENFRKAIKCLMGNHDCRENGGVTFIEYGGLLGSFGMHKEITYLNYICKNCGEIKQQKKYSIKINDKEDEVVNGRIPDTNTNSGKH